MTNSRNSARSFRNATPALIRTQAAGFTAKHALLRNCCSYSSLSFFWLGLLEGGFLLFLMLKPNRFSNRGTRTNSNSNEEYKAGESFFSSSNCCLICPMVSSTLMFDYQWTTGLIYSMGQWYHCYFRVSFSLWTNAGNLSNIFLIFWKTQIVTWKLL